MQYKMTGLSNWRNTICTLAAIVATLLPSALPGRMAAQTGKVYADEPVGGGGGEEGPGGQIDPTQPDPGGTTSDPLAPYKLLMAQMHAAMHGTTTNPGAFFRFDAFPQSTGQMMGTSIEGPITVDILYLLPIDPPSAESTEKFAWALVELAGSIGTAAALGCVVTRTNSAGVDGPTTFFPLASVSNANDGIIRFMRGAGPAIYSTPASIVAGHPDMARTPSPEGPAAYVACNAYPVDSRERCICRAQADYDKCMRDMREFLKICMTWVTVGTLAGLAACAATGLVPAIGWIGAGACAIAVAIAALIAAAACADNARYALKSCTENFARSMVDCGVHIYDIR